MMVEMIHHHGANKADPRHRHDRLSVLRQRPRGQQLRVIQLLQTMFRVAGAFVQSFQQLLATLRLRHGEVSNLPHVLVGHLSDLFLTPGDVHGQLTQRERLCVWLPAQFVIRNSL